ncbi:hypothetical protein STEG23_023485 [Scotinomys teguina]
MKNVLTASQSLQSISVLLEPCLTESSSTLRIVMKTGGAMNRQRVKRERPSYPLSTISMYSRPPVITAAASPPSPPKAVGSDVGKMMESRGWEYLCILLFLKICYHPVSSKVFTLENTALWSKSGKWNIGSGIAETKTGEALVLEGIFLALKINLECSHLEMKGLNVIIDDVTFRVMLLRPLTYKTPHFYTIFTS